MPGAASHMLCKSDRAHREYTKHQKFENKDVKLPYELFPIVSSKLNSSWRHKKGIRALLNKTQNSLCISQIMRRHNKQMINILILVGRQQVEYVLYKLVFSVFIEIINQYLQVMAEQKRQALTVSAFKLVYGDLIQGQDMIQNHLYSSANN